MSWDRTQNCYSSLMPKSPARPDAITVLFPWDGPLESRRALVSPSVPEKELREVTASGGRMAGLASIRGPVSIALKELWGPLLLGLVLVNVAAILAPRPFSGMLSGVSGGIALSLAAAAGLPALAHAVLARRASRFVKRYAAQIIDGGSGAETIMERIEGSGSAGAQGRERRVVHMVGCIEASPWTDAVDLTEAVAAAFRYRETRNGEDFALIESLHARAHGDKG